MMRDALAGVCRQMCGTSVQWRCDPLSTRQRIYFGNHSSHLDFVAVWSALPSQQRPWVRPVAARDYWERSTVRRLAAIRVFNAVLVDRSDPCAPGARERARATTAHIAREMGERYSLILFPEGTRSADGHLSAFKSGLYFLSCARPDVELVPVYLENLNRILPKGESLPAPVLSRVIFGEPLPRRDDDEEKTQFLARARAAVAELGGLT